MSIESTHRPRMRGRTVAALLPLVLAAVTAASCDPGRNQSPAAAAQQASSSAPALAGAAICGIPPCDKYLSRGETRTLNNAVSGHPIASALALHLVVSAFCGGVLCIWGEGVTFLYVQSKVHDAAQNGECLRVHVLPQGRAWQLVSLDGSNQSPYCTG